MLLFQFRHVLLMSLQFSFLNKTVKSSVKLPLSLLLTCKLPQVFFSNLCCSLICPLTVPKPLVGFFLLPSGMLQSSFGRGILQKLFACSSLHCLTNETLLLFLQSRQLLCIPICSFTLRCLLFCHFGTQQ